MMGPLWKSQQLPSGERLPDLHLKAQLLQREELEVPPELFQECHQQKKRIPAHILAGSAYCVASASMVLLNKAALSSFEFQGANSLLFFQCLVCCILVKLCCVFKLVRLEPWSFKIIQLWLPVNFVFVGMIWSSFFALKNLGVPMATVLKNVTNLFTIFGDYVFYGKVYGVGVWISLALMCLSAICGSVTDLAFNLEGYLWQLTNCLFTSGYSLYLRGVMDHVVPLTVNKAKLDEFSMVYYNNMLSLPLVFMLMFWHGEIDTVIKDPAMKNPFFIFAACMSAVVAFSISFASLWFLSTSTATSYSLVGSLNKIPVALIGLFAFNGPWNPENLASVFVGLIAGIVFVKAKSVKFPSG